MKKTTFLKTLLMAVGLCVGTNGAWADGTKRTLNAQNYETADTYDWVGRTNADLSLETGDATYGKYVKLTPSGTGNRSAYKAVSYGYTVGTGYTTTDVNVAGYVVEFDMQMLSGNVEDRSSSQFIIPTTGPNLADGPVANTYDTYVFSLSNGINFDLVAAGKATNRNEVWYINDLTNSSGSTVTLTYNKWYHYKLVVTASSVSYSILDGSTPVTNGNKTVESLPDIKGFFAVAGRGSGVVCFDNLDIYDYVDAEIVDNPSISSPAYAGANRRVTITAGESSKGNSVTTYYTIDGTTPTAENYAESFTTSSKEVTITSNCTVKAITISSAGVKSSVVSRDITVGKLTLKAPTVSVSSFALSGSVYYATYAFSSDQSSLAYTPGELTYTYTFNGGDATEASSYAATGAGTLVVTVSADNYTSNSTEVVVTSYTSTYYLNMYDTSRSIFTEPLGKDTNQGTTINGTGCSFHYLDGVVFNGLTISNMTHAWATSNNHSHSIYTRGNSTGTVTYNGTFPDGSYIYCLNAQGNANIISTTNSTSFAKYTGFRNLRVLVPSASATVYSLTSGTDLTNNGAFTSNVSGWATAGTITKESDSSTSGSGFGYNNNGWAEMWADNNSASADYAHYNSDCYIAQLYVNVPAGNYCVTADLVANGGNVSVFTISVNGEVKKTANGYFDSWTRKTYVVNVPSDGGCITVKYCPQVGGRAWVGIDNVSCVYGFNDVPVEVTSAGYATYVPSYDLDFTDTSLKAYTVEVASKGVATLHPINKVAAGTPVLLIGATEDVPVTTSTDEVPANHLVAGTGAAVATDGGTVDAVAYTNMILNNVSGIGFYFAAGQTVATNRAYLHFASTLAPNPESGAPMLLVFDNGDVTGISATLVNSEKVNSDVYDLQGRKVMNPTKGLYIVNGKKVIIK